MPTALHATERSRLPLGNRMQEARCFPAGAWCLEPGAWLQSPNTAVREMGRRTCGSHCVPRSRVDRGRADRSRGSTSRISRSRGGERRGAAASHDRARVRRCRSAKRRGFAAGEVGQRQIGSEAVLARTRTWVASGFGPTISRTVDTETPRHAVSNLVHFVTQWMSATISAVGSARNSSKLQRRRCRHLTADGKVPCRGVHFRHHTGVKHRKPIGGVLTGWKPCRIDALGGGAGAVALKE